MIRCWTFFRVKERKQARLCYETQEQIDYRVSYYVKPIDLKFKANPEIPILHVINTMRTNFQSKILSPGLQPAI